MQNLQSSNRNRVSECGKALDKLVLGECRSYHVTTTIIITITTTITNITTSTSQIIRSITPKALLAYANSGEVYDASTGGAWNGGCVQ